MRSRCDSAMETGFKHNLINEGGRLISCAVIKPSFGQRLEANRKPADLVKSPDPFVAYCGVSNAGLCDPDATGIDAGHFCTSLLCLNCAWRPCPMVRRTLFDRPRNELGELCNMLQRHGVE